MDPFTETLAAIWTLLESSTDFTDMVKTKNRIKLNLGSSKPIPTEYSLSDFPMVVVEPFGNININMSKSSSSASFIQRYRITAYDGDKRPTKYYFPLKWTIFCVLANTDADLSLNYVRNVNFADMGDEVGEDDVHPGWYTTFDLDVEMWFDRAYMKSNI